jgi:hypothetical protein
MAWFDEPSNRVPGSQPATPGNLRPLGYQQITSLSSAVGLTVPRGATLALIRPETQSIRWRDDGANPTASVGMVLVADETLPYIGYLENLKFIEVTASAILNISYYG